MLDLSRELDVKQSLYLFLLQQEESTAITKASNIPSASVIAVPKSEYKPYFPSKTIVLGISGILGLIFPVAFIILKYTLNSHIISRDDIKEKTDCPILQKLVTTIAKITFYRKSIAELYLQNSFAFSEAIWIL